MAMYSALFAVLVQSRMSSFDGSSSSPSTFIWEFENQRNAPHTESHDNWTIIYDLKITHGDQKLGLEYVDDEIRRAQNKTSSERVE